MTWKDLSHRTLNWQRNMDACKYPLPQQNCPTMKSLPSNWLVMEGEFAESHLLDIHVLLVLIIAVTHSTNTDQRFVELRILEVKGDEIKVRAPWSRAMAVPGNWMLWVLDDRGVPSESATVLMKMDNTGTDFSLTDPNPVTDDFYSAFSSAWISSKLSWILAVLGVFVM